MTNFSLITLIELPDYVEHLLAQENVAEQVRLIIAGRVPSVFSNIFLGRYKIQIKQSVNRI